MDAFMLLLGWLGIYFPVALAAIGSAIGCTRAGKAACGALLEVDGDVRARRRRAERS